MADSFSPLRRSLHIVSTLWLPAMFLYFFENVAYTRSLGVPALWTRFIDPAIGFVTQSIFYIWLWGLTVETISGESNIVRYKNFRSFLKKGWWIAVAVQLAPWIVHFLIYMMAGRELLSLSLIKALIIVFVIYWAAREVIRIKYSSFLSGKLMGAFLSRRVFFYLIVFLLSSVLVQHMGDVFSQWPFVIICLRLLSIQLSFLAFAVFSCVLIDANPSIADGFKSLKNLILVNPVGGSIRTEAFSSILVRRYPPFFAVLQALTPKEYRVIEYNRVIWREHFYRGDALVAITCFTTNCAAAYQIAREFRSRGSKVIMGGPHVSFFPDEALEFCDSVVVGPAESAWPEVVRDYEAGDLKRVYCGECSEKESGTVHQFLMQSPPEVVKDCLQISPGCKFNCFFCAANALTGRSRPKKKIEDMIALVKRVSIVKRPVVFIDNNIYEDPEYAKELFRALIPLKQTWGSNASIDIAQDDETVRLLKESRCVQLMIGYEIDSDSPSLKHEGKFTLAKDYLRLTKRLQKVGVGIQAQFIFGFPGDSWSTLLRLWKFCLKLGPRYTIVSFLTPLPGSRYFEDSVRRGRIINLNWRAYDITRQVIEHESLPRSWIMQNCFTLFVLLIFFTTSFAGRLALVFFCVLELVYFRVAT